jgi:hypothetical protein
LCWRCRCCLVSGPGFLVLAFMFGVVMHDAWCFYLC